MGQQAEPGMRGWSSLLLGVLSSSGQAPYTCGRGVAWLPGSSIKSPGSGAVTPLVLFVYLTPGFVMIPVQSLFFFVS